MTQPRYETPVDFRVEISKRSDLRRIKETAPLTVAESWPWGSQIAVKKQKVKKYLSHM